MVYIIGGVDGDKRSVDSVQGYRVYLGKRGPHEDFLEELDISPMNERRRCPGMAANDVAIFVCGGYDSTQLDSCEVYDPDDDRLVPLFPTG